MKIEALFEGLNDLGVIDLKKVVVEDRKAVAVFDVPLTYGFSLQGWNNLVEEFDYYVYDVAISLDTGEVIMELRKHYQIPTTPVPV